MLAPFYEYLKSATVVIAKNKPLPYLTGAKVTKTTCIFLNPNVSFVDVDKLIPTIPIKIFISFGTLKSLQVENSNLESLNLTSCIFNNLNK